jgi:serine/threonine protein kinase
VGRLFAESRLRCQLIAAVACGQVYRAICKQYNEEVAVKLLDLENMNCSLDEIVREAQVRLCKLVPWHGGR